MRWSAIVLGCLALSGCSRPSEPAPPPTASSAPPAPPAPPSASVAFPETVPVPERIVAIGDLHGDLDATRRALRLAGAIDGADKWKGGKLVVVQTGDEIDRGDDDRAILDMIERLKGEAKDAGGALVALVGNHEIMNAMFDFRYVTPAAFTTFEAQLPKAGEESKLAKLEPATWGRAAAFMPGSGKYATMLASRPVIARVGGTFFVHGGILPKHVSYGLARINTDASEWLLGKRSTPPAPLTADDGPLWTRLYSQTPNDDACRTLHGVLSSVGGKRLVMGHTVQPHTSSACHDEAWRIDVGMSKFFSGPIEVLEIKGDEVKVLKE